jgi:hypothetical protein
LNHLVIRWPPILSAAFSFGNIHSTSHGKLWAVSVSLSVSTFSRANHNNHA